MLSAAEYKQLLRKYIAYGLSLPGSYSDAELVELRDLAREAADSLRRRGVLRALDAFSAGGDTK